MIKDVVKKVVPTGVWRRMSRLRLRKYVKDIYAYDFDRYFKYSGTTKLDAKPKMIGKVIQEYHVIEKGLTMPETKLGFGKAMMLSLISNINEYCDAYGLDDVQLRHAIAVVFEYEEFHRARKFDIDEDVRQAIDLLKFRDTGITSSCQINTTRSDYFSDVDAPFSRFAASRCSVRNYSDAEVPMDLVLDSLRIAMSAPSACNRQSWRPYVFSDKDQISKILQLQGGNRGFGHLANKLILIAGEIGVFGGFGERNACYVDGGMYAMNVLYGLHANKIAACILNCSFPKEKDMVIRSLTGMKESEVFIAMIACGIPPEEFRVARSDRYNLEDLVTIHE